MTLIRKLAFGDLAPALSETLKPTVERLGYFGELFQYLGHTPEALAAFMKFSGALRSAIPPNLNELIALVVCTDMKCAYERIQHERLALTLNLSREWIAGLVGHGPLVTLSAPETQVRALTRKMVAGNSVDARRSLDELAASEGDALAIAVLLQITRFMSICAMGSMLMLAPPVTSIFAADITEAP